MHDDKLRTHAIACLAFAVAVSGCTLPLGPSAEYVEWVFVIPDNYEGYLLIRYDCPGGQPLSIQSHTAEVEFDDNGTYCTSESFQPSWSHGDRARTRSGSTVPVYSGPFDWSGNSYEGYGLYGGDTLGVGGGTLQNPGPDMTFSVYWAGDMARAFAAHQESGAAFPDDIDEFLVNNFGLTPIPPQE